MDDTRSTLRNVQAVNAAGRDINLFPDTSKLKKLLDLAAKEMEENTEVREFIEGLQRYIDNATDSPVLGLEIKLRNAGRDTEIAKATELKERFSKMLYRHALSPSAQKIYAYLLANIEMLFEHKVKPLIDSSASKAEIDMHVADDVISGAYKDVDAANELGIYAREIRGMMYFLTGNCHINWTPAC